MTSNKTVIDEPLYSGTAPMKPHCQQCLNPEPHPPHLYILPTKCEGVLNMSPETE